MSMIKTIQKTLNVLDINGNPRRWIIKYDNKDKIKEVKLLYQDTIYKGSRTILTDEQVLEKLINEKKNK